MGQERRAQLKAEQIQRARLSPDKKRELGLLPKRKARAQPKQTIKLKEGR